MSIVEGLPHRELSVAFLHFTSHLFDENFVTCQVPFWVPCARKLAPNTQVRLVSPRWDYCTTLPSACGLPRQRRVEADYWVWDVKFEQVYRGEVESDASERGKIHPPLRHTKNSRTQEMKRLLKSHIQESETVNPGRDGIN